jgi:Cyclin C-terminal domain
VVQIRAQNAPLCRDELRAVTIQEIEEAERSLLEGCVYHLRCHHPYGAIKVLSADVTTHSLSTPKETSTLDCSTSVGATKSYGHGGSPRSVYGYQAHQDPPVDESLNTICERALSIAQSALVYSDVNFLFPPGQIAFAAVTLALDGHRTGGTVGPRMSEYLSIRFRNKSSEELSQFKGEVRKIIRHLDNCPAIDLDRFSPSWQYRDGRAAEMQAAEIRRVFHVAARCRVMKGATFQVIGHPRSLPPPPSSVISPVEGYYHQNHHHYNSHHHLYFEGGGRKRDREECDQWTPYHHAQYYKVARITPITTPFV